MKKILNISTIISTGVLNFIKAADKNSIAEKNIFVFVDGNEYKAKEEDNGVLDFNDSNSELEFFKKRIDNETIFNSIMDKSTYDIYTESSKDGISYIEWDNKPANFLKSYFFKKTEVANNKLKINNTVFTEEKIQSLEILKIELKNLEKDLNEQLKNLKKLESIYIFLNRNRIIEHNNLIVSYKIDGNETKIDNFITIDDLEKIYEAISQKKSVDIVSKEIDINYYFNGRYSFNNKEFTEEQFNKLINLCKILDSNYISFKLLTEEEVKIYLKNQYGIDGKVIFESDENGKCITLPNKYLLCRVKLSLRGKEIEGKTLKYNYLNQLKLNGLKIYPKGTKYSELEKYIKDQFKFLEGKKYTLYHDIDSENIKIKNDDEIKPGDVTICIDDDKVNNDLYEAINKNIKNVKIGRSTFYLENVKNKDILDLVRNILNKGCNKKIEDLDIKFLNSKNEEIEIKDDENNLDNKFYVDKDNICINLKIEMKKKKLEDDKDKGKENENKDNKKGNDDKTLNGEQINSGDGKSTEEDKKKEKNKGYSAY